MFEDNFFRNDIWRSLLSSETVYVASGSVVHVIFDDFILTQRFVKIHTKPRIFLEPGATTLCALCVTMAATLASPELRRFIQEYD